MVSLFNLSGRSKKVTPSRRTHDTVSSEILRTYDKVPAEIPWSLDFWYLESGNRERLIADIMPYMAGSLERDPVQDFREDFPWAREFVSVEHANEANDSSASFDGSIEEFRSDPELFIDDLSELTSLVFFAILRHCYRIRFLAGREAFRRHFDLEDLDADLDGHYKGRLTDAEVSRLTCIRNKYGASYYRKKYDEAQKRHAWRTYTARVRSFCRIYDLDVRDDPKKNLEKLRRALPRIKLHWETQDNHLRNQMVEQQVSEVSLRSNLEFDNIRQEIQGMHTETRERLDGMNLNLLRERAGSMERASPFDSRLEEVEDSAASSTPRISSLEDRLGEVEHSSASSVPRISSLESRLDEVEGTAASSTPRLESLENSVTELTKQLHGGRHQVGLSADTMMNTRWLLERLPRWKQKNPASDTADWKRFCEDQWTNKDKDGHPFNGLGDEYKKNALKLYNTISDWLHHYGHKCDEDLAVRDQILVDRIKPIHFIGKKVDLPAEKKRWEV